MKTIFYSLAMALTMLGVQNTAEANNIQLANAQLSTFNASDQWVQVKFDLSWENSWRASTGPSNYDAVWVFVKFQVGTTDPTFTGASSSGTTVTVTSTANLRVGMPVSVTSGTGAFAANTVISSITNTTQFVVSDAPTTALSSANIKCARIWEHARLDSSGHVAASGSSITPGLLTPGSAYNASSNPALGVFIYRSAAGSGNNSFSNTKLKWHYGGNGVTDTAQIMFKVFATEMVYVPQGSFYAGDGSSSDITAQFENGTTGLPLLIESEGQLTLGGGSAGSLGNNNNKYGANNGQDDFNDVTSQTLPAAFPKGYKAFYCMKYELTQQQYVDFLNTLTYTQQAGRIDGSPGAVAGTYSNPNNSRHTIKIKTQGVNPTTPAVYETETPFVPKGIAGDIDGAAYMDWAGLRPMTELEFEKACRGTVYPVANEYAWGTATIASSKYTLSNAGASNEAIATNYSTTVGNGVSTATHPSGMVRVGIFATSGSNRVTSGATYYGIREMSGNAYERTVSVAKSNHRLFTGLHGDGMLATNGDPNVTNWPPLTTADAYNFRGGCKDGLSYLRVSDRLHGAAQTGNVNTRSFDVHAAPRGVRTAQ